MAPPRHGKTMLMGEGLGPCLMARSPGAHVIYATHSQTLADKVSIKARRKVAEHLAPVFSHLEPSPAKWTASWWETAGGNSFRAVGVGVGTAGEGANIAIEDDPFGSKEDAYSAREQERVLDHYLSDIETRIMRGGGVAIMHTRWHRGDLIGRLMEQQPGAWRVLSWPAIAEADEPHRRAGEALVPHLFRLERLHHLRQILSQQHGGAMWEALYQQHPSSPAGDIVKRDWWKHYTLDPRKQAESCDELLQSWDCTFKDTDGSDYVVGQIWGRRGADKYLLDQVRDRMSFTATCAAIRSLSAKWPRADLKLIEDKANGSAVIETLQREVSGIVAVDPQGGKEARARAVSPQVEAGNVFLPANAPWVQDYVEEWAAFPRGKHDDQVDGTTQALMRMAARCDDWEPTRVKSRRSGW
jgi:predicted phage terminase large subunit-like protein